jgi:hypothetical protein
MGLFSKKEDTKNLKEFDIALDNLNALSKKFRALHFKSLEQFEKNFDKEKTSADLQKERVLFEAHLDILQQLRMEADKIVDEAFMLVRDENSLTEKDRLEIRKAIEPKRESTNIKVKSRK